MFGAVRQRRTAMAALSVSESAPRGVSALPLPERAAALAVANAMLRVAAVTYGQDALARPAALPRKTLFRIVADLAEAHAKLLDILAASEGKGMKDPDFAAAMRQLRATETLMLTFGAVLAPQCAEAMRRCWKALWTARGSALDAVRILRRYETGFGADALPLPDGAEPWTDREIAKLAASLPPMFVRKKTADGKVA
jgi:hypothetical protein